MSTLAFKPFRCIITWKGNSLQFLCTPYIWESQSIFNIKQIFTNSFQLNGWLLSFEIWNSSNCILPGLSRTKKKKIHTHLTKRRRKKENGNRFNFEFVAPANKRLLPNRNIKETKFLCVYCHLQGTPNRW